MESKGTSGVPPIRQHRRKIEISQKIEETIPSLPEEIVIQILASLPVKSLLKFRCVSKSWRSLISSQHLIKSHLKNSIKNPNFEHHMIVATTLRPNFQLQQCSLHSLLYEPVTRGVNFDYPMKNPENSFRVVGCCDGLVCIIVNGRHFFLWNPSTRQVNKLPEIDDKLKSGFSILTYGFGFDESSDDYKVLGIVSIFWPEGKYEWRARIYSLKTNSWKKVENFTAGSPFDESGIFVSGRLHWEKRPGVSSDWGILSFDLGSEVSGMVEQPDYIEGEFHSSLGLVGGCLCVLCDYSESRVDVWVMKKYGVKESWEIKVSVPYCSDPRKGPYLSYPLCIAPTGEILIACGIMFLIYDPKDNVFRRRRTVDFDEFNEVDVYVESLISPFSERQNPEHCSE